MREIKFRVWDKKEKQMNWTDKPQLNQGRAVKFNFMMPWRRNIFSNEWELMQFTGLHDKNGKEVYEGDIVYSNQNHPFQVYWNTTRLGFLMCKLSNHKNQSLTYQKSLTVIGNIYENPELLERTQ